MMERIIKDVLEHFKDANLHSEVARDSIAKEIIKMLNEKTGTNYLYSRDLIENKDEEQIDLFPTYEGGHLG